MAQITTVACLAGALCACASSHKSIDSPAVGRVLMHALRDADLAAWRELILPTSEELAFERVAWLPSFHEGMERANIERKPLLLWVMNGHPLGCT